VASDPGIGFDTAGWFGRFGNGDLNVFADSGNFWACYLRILGSDNGTYPGRYAYYERALLALENTETEEKSVVVTPQDIVNEAYNVLGAPYREWTLGAQIPMWRGDGAGDPPSPEHILEYGVMCSDLVSYALMRNGLPPCYGTEALATYLVDQVPFDPTTPGVPGAIALRPYTGPALRDQGHVGIYVDEHTLIQALYTPGVTDNFTDAETYSWGGSTEFTVYGLLPGVDYSMSGTTDPGGGGSEEPLWKRYGWYEYESADSWSLKYHEGS
jgi:hypothetical protein